MNPREDDDNDDEEEEEPVSLHGAEGSTARPAAAAGDRPALLAASWPAAPSSVDQITDRRRHGQRRQTDSETEAVAAWGRLSWPGAGEAVATVAYLLAPLHAAGRYERH